MKKHLKPISRRTFLKTGIGGGAIIATLPLWKAYSYSNPPNDFYTNPDFYLSKENITKLLDIALQYGGDFSEVYIEYKVENKITMENNIIKNSINGIDMGVGIRVIKGGKVGYSFSDDFDFNILKETAKLAGQMAGSTQITKPQKLMDQKIPSYYLINTYPDNVELKDKIKIIQYADQEARKYDQRVKDVEVSFRDINKKITIANSKGIYAQDTQVLSNLKVTVYAKDKNKKSSGYDNYAGTIGFKHYNNDNIKITSREAVRMAIDMLPAQPSPAGQFPVVFGAGKCGTFVHEIIGHSLEGDGIQSKNSMYHDKLGQKIALPHIKITDDSTLPGKPGTINIDDEGTRGQKTNLIENGICVSFLTDLLNAKLLDKKPTGNGRRQSYQYPPKPRMTNTFINNGKSDKSKCIKTIKEGAYIAKLGGGGVTPATGNFTFQVNECYWIKNGKLTHPILGLQVAGDSKDILHRIELVSNDLKVSGIGTCGKGGQDKTVGFGNPTFKVSKINISGSKR